MVKKKKNNNVDIHPVPREAIGAVRGEEDFVELLRRVDRTSAGGQALAMVGISELVRDREAVFRANHSPYFHRLIKRFRLQLKNVIERVSI